jgi:hypothetical protein
MSCRSLPRRLELCLPRVASVGDSLRKHAKRRLTPWVSFQIRGGLNADTLLRDGQPLRPAGSFLPILAVEAVRGADWLVVGLRAMKYELQSVTICRTCQQQHTVAAGK